MSQNQPGPSGAAYSTGADPTKRLGDRPTMQGRLQEVDLGEEVRMRNAAMTEQARRRLAGEAVDEDSDDPRKRVRIGKDGKPWRSRKRRASDAAKRDQMVEELMRENRRMLPFSVKKDTPWWLEMLTFFSSYAVDVYEVPVQPEASTAPGNDEAADERIAEKFRREFMDAMAERRNQRRRAPAPPPRPGAKQEEILRGPKLGGSRNARAAMRDILLSQQEKNKKR